LKKIAILTANKSNMGLFYKAKPKELVSLRNDIFIAKGIPALTQKGFVRSPFSTSCYGRDQQIGFIYNLCRLNDHSELETITVYIVRGDRWIQIHLNIFELTPTVTSIEKLTGRDGLQYELPPNSISKMRLRMDEVKGVPLFDLNFMFRNHKIYSYYTQKGLKRRVNQLGSRIENDLLNIEHFIKRWHELYKPNKTNWEGQPIG
jgi:hypothetical protein